MLEKLFLKLPAIIESYTSNMKITKNKYMNMYS